MKIPSKPSRPVEPKKPEKTYTVSRQKNISLYDNLKFVDLINNIKALELSHDSLYFRTESCGSSYGEETLYLSYDVPETITLDDNYFDKQMKKYDLKMQKYKEKLASYEFRLANYEKDLQTWEKETKEAQREKDVKEFERLKKRLKL
jgi:hypothetical protein